LTFKLHFILHEILKILNSSLKEKLLPTQKKMEKKERKNYG